MQVIQDTQEVQQSVTLNQIIKQGNSTVKEFRGKLQEIKKQQQEQLKNFCKQFFEACPEFKTIAFYGYTPSWNDGEACEHSLRDPVIVSSEDKEIIDQILLEDTDDEYLKAQEIVYYDGCYGGVFGDISKTDGDYVQDLNNFCNILKCILDMCSKDMFGTNVKVYITKDHIRTEEYECGW